MAKDITRRALLRSGTTLATLGAVGMIASQCIPVEAPAAAATITTMFARWHAIRERDSSGDTEAQAQRSYLEYRTLQENITAATPTTARDLAIQVYVETDGGESDYRDGFFQRLAALAIGDEASVAAAPPADPFVPRFERFRAELDVFNGNPDAWPADRLEPWNTLCRELDTGEIAIGSATGAVMAMGRIKDLDCIIDGEAESYLDAIMAFLKARA